MGQTTETGSATLRARRLAVEGAFELTPTVFPDDRGLFLSPFQEPGFLAATGHRLFPVAQTNHSLSARGVVRGVHFTVTPPGSAKYVYCPHGRALDIIVDIRVGSPTFGACDAVLLDQTDFRAMYFPVGVGHAFVALADDTVMAYLVSSSYVAENELAISPFDPALELPVPSDIEPIVSDRDRAAPTFAEALERGVLPTYEHSLRVEKELYG
jgi:epimerase EvaD